MVGFFRFLRFFKRVLYCHDDHSNLQIFHTLHLQTSTTTPLAASTTRTNTRPYPNSWRTFPEASTGQTWTKQSESAQWKQRRQAILSLVFRSLASASVAKTVYTHTTSLVNLTIANWELVGLGLTLCTVLKVSDIQSALDLRTSEQEQFIWTKIIYMWKSCVFQWNLSFVDFAPTSGHGCHHVMVYRLFWRSLKPWLNETTILR